MNIPDSVWTSIVVALLVKVAWDYWQSGRVEKGIYLERTEFDKHRENCCAIQLKKQIAIDKNDTIAARTLCHAWMDEAEKDAKQRAEYYDRHLEKGAACFTKILSELAEMRTAMAIIANNLSHLTDDKRAWDKNERRS